MSKSILGVVLAVVGIAVAVFAPELLPVIGLAAGTLAGTAVIAAIEIGIALTSSLLLGPGSPRVPNSLASRSRLYVTLDPAAPRKMAFGTTALATDMRYQAYTGDNQDVYEQIICLASHQVNAINEIWLDNEQAWTVGGGVQGRYAGYLSVTPITLGTSANGIAIDSTWTASCTLTGCAYAHLTYTLSDNSDSDKSPFSGGITTRVTIRGNGALVYDPRLDGTVSGGAGAQRAATQSTWAWSSSASRNPALQLLWYLLGWQINGKLAVGMGIPSARIDLPSFITAANACDASITLNGGGTEPRYRTDGVMSEGDDRKAVIDALCSQMNAVLRDAGGKLSLTVMTNDLGSPVASFTEADILGGEQWDQTPDLHTTFNVVRGKRVDPSDTSLYQAVDYPEINLASNDGIDRIDSFDLLLTQSNGQAQRLAKQRLERAQYQGRYSALFGARAWRVSVGDPVQLSHQGLGWANKLFRVAAQTINSTGQTKMVLLEENAAIYAWGNNESAAVTPGVGTTYDPLNSPILQGVMKGYTNNGTNILKDIQFGRAWTLSIGATRHRANATSGYALGSQPYYCELSPSTSLVRSAKSELVRVAPGQRIYFKIDCQRGTTLGSGSRLHTGHDWVKADRTTLSATASVEGAIQTPSGLTAGADPLSVYWSDVAPADATFVRIKPYTAALASSSGTFRVEAPVVSKIDLGGAPSLSLPVSAFTVDYNADGTIVSGELPFDVGASLLLGGVAQTSGVTWGYVVKTGSVNGHASGVTSYSMTGTGSGTLTVSSLEADASTISVTGTSANGSNATALVSISKVYASGTSTGGGGASGGDANAQTTGFTPFSSATFGAISNTLTYTIPSGQTTATVTFNFSCRPPRTGSSPPWTIELKIQRNISGTWTDVGSTLSGTSDVDNVDGMNFAVAASISGSRQSTGLTAATQYQWRAVARIASGSTGVSNQHSVTGSISVASP